MEIEMLDQRTIRVTRQTGTATEDLTLDEILDRRTLVASEISRLEAEDTELASMETQARTLGVKTQAEIEAENG